MMEFLENELNEESINKSDIHNTSNTINCEILRDIILDHNLCFVQKEELTKVIDLFSGICKTVYIIPKIEIDKSIKVIFED